MVLLAQIIFLLTGTVFSQAFFEETTVLESDLLIDVIYDTIPSDLQFFGRDSQDSATIIVSGKLLTPGYDSVLVEVFKNGSLFSKQSKALTYVEGIADFTISSKIYAETVSYNLNISFSQGGTIESHKTVQNLICGDVIIVHGQSNAWAEDYDNVEVYQSNWIRTLGRTAWYNQPTPADITDSSWYIAQGHSTNTQAAIGVYALELARLIVENHGIPVCVFNGSGGGGAISYFLRNDSNPMDLNTVYGRLLYRVRKANLTNNVKLITWNQGESESGNGYITYANDFDELYTDLKEDYPNIEKIYLFQIPPGCVNNPNADRLREVQRLLPESFDDVEIMSRCGLPGHNWDYCHYHFEGYSTKAFWSYRQISSNFFGINWNYNVNPPMILQCGYINQSEIALIFDQPVQVSNDTMVQGNTYYLKDHIYLNGQSGVINTLFTSGDSVILKTNSAIQFSNISYTPNKFYNNSTEVYEGPWIKGADNQIGTLTFFQFPVEDLTTGIGPQDKSHQISIYPNPAKDIIYVEMFFNKPADVRIEIIDSIGRCIDIRKFNSTGENVKSLKTDALVNGVYIVRVLYNNQSYSKKIIVDE